MWEYIVSDDYEYFDDCHIYKAIYSENPVRIFVEDEIPPNWNAWTKYPYYQMRGKRITPEQAFDVISKTDRLFWGYDFYSDIDNRCFEEKYILSTNFHNDWFGFDSKYGWVHPNGIIGINNTTSKYPTLREFVLEWWILLNEFPFLDLIIGVVMWREDAPDCYMKEYRYEPYDNFCKALEIGIWVHDRKVEIVGKKRAAELYKEYEQAYEEPNKKVYVCEYYSDFEPNITTRDYLYRCLKLTYGIEDPERFIKENISSYKIKGLK